MHQVVINIEDNMIDNFLNYFRELPQTGIKIVSDKTMVKKDATTIADDYLKAIDDPYLVTMMKEIRVIRGTPPQFADDKNDKELFAEAIEMEFKELGEIQ